MTICNSKVYMSSLAVDHFMRFCVDANIDHKNIADSLKKYLLAYQRNILHKGAFTALFEKTPITPPLVTAVDEGSVLGSEDNPPPIPTPQQSSYINWEYIERNLPKLDCAH